MANKVKFGLKNVYYAKATDDGTGTLTYAAPVRIPGAVNMALDPSGDMEPFYADDIIYYASAANNGYTGTLEIALIPESFRTDILGEVADQNGVLVENAEAEPAEFALLFQFTGDKNGIRHCLYRCTAARPSVNGATREGSKTPQTDTLNLTVMPRISDFVVKSKCDATTAETQYNNWFNTVYEPVN